MTASPNAIIGATCSIFAISDEQFFGFDTRHTFKHARSAAAYLIEDMTSLKGVQITRALGRSGDASVARNMLARARALLANDPAFAEKVSVIREEAPFWEPKPVVRAVPTSVAAVARKSVEDPPDVVEMRRMIESGTEMLRLALLRESEPANAGDVT